MVKSLTFAVFAMTIIGAYKAALAANVDLVALGRNGDITWYLVIHKDPMAETEKRELMGVEDNEFTANDYVYLECYEGKVYVRYDHEYGWPEGGQVEIMKIGSTFLQGAKQNSYAFAPQEITDLSGTLHFGKYDHNGKPRTIDSFSGFNGNYLEQLPDCES